MPSFELNHPDARPYSDASSLAVAIGSLDPTRPEQFHIGLLYRYAAQQYLLHMAWHNRFLKNDLHDLANEYCWVDCNIDDSEREFLAMQCHRVYQRNGKNIPYDINSESCHFDSKTAKLIIDEEFGGLTCSTFVLRLFEDYALPLIVKEGWPKRRNKNRKWQRGIIKLLRKHSNASKEHLDAQLFMVGKGVLRFPPDEVAAAAARSPHPQRFAWVLDDAQYIKDVLLGKKLTL